MCCPIWHKVHLPHLCYLPHPSKHSIKHLKQNRLQIYTSNITQTILVISPLIFSSHQYPPYLCIQLQGRKILSMLLKPENGGLGFCSHLLTPTYQPFKVSVYIINISNLFPPLFILGTRHLSPQMLWWALNTFSGLFLSSLYPSIGKSPIYLSSLSSSAVFSEKLIW